MVAPKKIIMGRGESAVSIGRTRRIARKPVVMVKPKTKTKIAEPASNVKVINKTTQKLNKPTSGARSAVKTEKPRWDSEGKPLNLAARLELNKAIRNSAIAKQNALKAKKLASGAKSAVKKIRKDK